MRLEGWLDAPVGKEGEGEEAPQDKNLLYDFLKGKSEVYVDDIKKRSGVNPDLVDSLVDAGIRNGSIEVVKAGLYGVPFIISLKED